MENKFTEHGITVAIYNVVDMVWSTMMDSCRNVSSASSVYLGSLGGGMGAMARDSTTRNAQPHGRPLSDRQPRDVISRRRQPVTCQKCGAATQDMSLFDRPATEHIDRSKSGKSKAMCILRDLSTSIGNKGLDLCGLWYCKPKRTQNSGPRDVSK